MFNEERWRRVGADDDQVNGLRVAYDAMDAEQQEAEDARVSSLPDDELRAELGGQVAPPAPPASLAQPTIPPTAANVPQVSVPAPDGGDEE